MPGDRVRKCLRCAAGVLSVGLRAVAVALLWAYRLLVSPLLPATCRFQPSCSVYAEQAIRRYGVVRGSLLAGRRLLRCHPWHPGGYDPVP